jgi:hypothetical protein
MNPAALPIIYMTAKILNYNTRPINFLQGSANVISTNWSATGEWTKSSAFKIMVVVYYQSWTKIGVGWGGLEQFEIRL